MITRAGALDQGNLILNLQDSRPAGIAQNVLFLAGSAINSIKNAQGDYDPRLGLEAMVQAIEVHRSGELTRCADRRTPRGTRRAGRAEEADGLARSTPPALSGEEVEHGEYWNPP